MNDVEPSSPSLGFLRSGEQDPPVTVIRVIHVRPGSEGRFEMHMGVLIAEATRQPGHLGATIIRPRAPGDGYRFVYKFDRRSNLLTWHRSDRRAQLYESVAEMIVSERIDEYPGLETWFDLPSHAAPPKWKTTLMSWAAIYVLVVVISYAIQAAGIKLSVPVGAFVLTGVVVPLVAYVVGPLLGRLLHGWLHAGGGSN